MPDEITYRLENLRKFVSWVRNSKQNLYILVVQSHHKSPKKKSKGLKTKKLLSLARPKKIKKPKTSRVISKKPKHGKKKTKKNTTKKSVMKTAVIKKTDKQIDEESGSGDESYGADDEVDDLLDSITNDLW